jgi:hypothetical protein
MFSRLSNESAILKFYGSFSFITFYNQFHVGSKNKKLPLDHISPVGFGHYDQLP